MNIFDLLIVQPIFNVLMVIYGLIPGGDFGISVIIFTVLVRLLMWPLVKKQLHQTKVMRAIQPELKKIKAKAKGNKQLEAQLMMELYRERGVNPFSSIGLLIVQLPIFIALYQVINIVTQQRDRIELFTYDVFEKLGSVGTLIADPSHFNETLLGLVNLADTAIGGDGLYIPLVLLAMVAAGLQYVQSKQITPQPEGNKRLRDVLKAQSAGKQVDQSEVSSIVTNRMIIFLPLITLVISLYLPGALVLYFAASSLVAVIQQHLILNRDVDEMEALADKNGKKKPTAKARAEKAKVAEVVSTNPPQQKAKPRKSKKRKKR